MSGNRYLLNTNNNRVFGYTTHLARRRYMVELTQAQVKGWEAEVAQAAKEGRDPQFRPVSDEVAEQMAPAEPPKKQPIPRTDEKAKVDPNLDLNIDVSTMDKRSLRVVAGKAGLEIPASTKVRAMREQIQLRLDDLKKQASQGSAKGKGGDSKGGSKEGGSGKAGSKEGNTKEGSKE